MYFNLHCSLINVVRSYFMLVKVKRGDPVMREIHCLEWIYHSSQINPVLNR